MNRQDLFDYRDNQESLNSRLSHIRELRDQVYNITSLISDMPKRK
jgi:hypothetical protein